MHTPDIRIWRTPHSLLGYKKAYGWAIVAGAPISAPEHQEEVLSRFEQHHSRVAYFCAENDFATTHQKRYPYRIYLGSQPVWTPADWRLATSHASLRYQCHRAKNKGVTVIETDMHNPQNVAALHALRHAWLASHGLPPLHFLVESDVFDTPGARQIFSAIYQGHMVAALVVAPIFRQRRYLVEVTMRHPDAPNGCIEYILDYVFSQLPDMAMLTLGLSPLRPDADHRNPLWIQGLFAAIRHLGRPFYNVEGLRGFKEKCRPGHWEPLFMLSRHPITPLALAAVAKVFFKKEPRLQLVNF